MLLRKITVGIVERLLKVRSTGSIDLESGATIRVVSAATGIATATLGTAELAGLDISTRLVLAGAALTVTAALHDNKTILLDQLAGSVCTLPAATGSGNRFKFVIHTVPTSNSHIVKVANGTDVMAGIALTAQDGGDTLVAFETAASSDTITFNRTTTGGTQKGEYIEVEDIASGFFAVRVVNAATGTEASPFSATV